MGQWGGFGVARRGAAGVAQNAGGNGGGFGDYRLHDFLYLIAIIFEVLGACQVLAEGRYRCALAELNTLYLGFGVLASHYG
jgi:hypothetical protein